MNKNPFDDEIERAICGMGELAMRNAKIANPDFGYVVSMINDELIRHCVDGRDLKLSDIKAEKERLIKRNVLLKQLNDLEEKKDDLSKKDLDRLYSLIDGVIEALVVERMKQWELNEEILNICQKSSITFSKELEEYGYFIAREKVEDTLVNLLESKLVHGQK